ncbi:MAG: sigma-70 family RNA polymerase sigma factor [Roseburia sp.]|nr:sigma-70 family RNA polymerase sigma factor [Roseburia sp.]
MFFPGKDTKEQKIEKLLLENYNRYYRLAISYVHNEADAADIVQNGAYKAILNSDTLRQEEYAATWIYRIMLNEIFRFLKRETPASMDEIPAETGREDTYENLDLKRALDAMDEADKAVIELRYFEDMKFEEIARVMDENVNTVKSRLYRGLKKLRLELADTWQWE